MDDMFTAAPLPEPSQYDRWLDQPVFYLNMVVSRYTAMQLCMNEHQSWLALREINDLPEYPDSEGLVIDAATAFHKVAQGFPINPGRDV